MYDNRLQNVCRSVSCWVGVVMMHMMCERGRGPKLKSIETGTKVGMQKDLRHVAATLRRSQYNFHVDEMSGPGRCTKKSKDRRCLFAPRRRANKSASAIEGSQLFSTRKEEISRSSKARRTKNSNHSNNNQPKRKRTTAIVDRG